MQARGTATSELFVEEFHRQLKLKREGKFKYTCSDSEVTNYQRLAVLTEEVGEVARELNDWPDASPGSTAGAEATARLRAELVQVAAVCLAWLESDCI
jgi:hypothetical protein